MGKQKQKYYAVYNGREGTQVYLTWEETKENVARVPGVKYKSFQSLEAAQAWLEGCADGAAAGAYSPSQHSRANGKQPMQRQHIPNVPRMQSGSAGPAAYGAAQQPQVGAWNDDAMDVDNFDSDIEIMEVAPPPTRLPSYYDEDSDIECLDGPPADWGLSRSASRTPQRQQQSVAGPSRRATLARVPPVTVKREPKQEPLPVTVKREPKQESLPVTVKREPKQEPLPVIVKREQTQEPGSANGGGEDDAPPLTAPVGLPTTGPVHDIQLSPDQLYVLSKVRNHESVFFTGSAGTGKSVLLREIIKHCGGRPSNKLGVTASTGIASINIGGCTLHSWAGIGLGKDDKDGLVGKILGFTAKAYKADVKRRQELWAKKAKGQMLTGEEEAFLNTDPSETRKNKVLERWKQCKTLIIDEISMIDGKLFDKLEYVGRKLRRNELPFGGIQLVLSGDFCQLPPVPDKSATGAQIPACFAFAAESWDRCVDAPIELRKVFRQKDQKFVQMLNSMRFGNMDAAATLSFRQLSREVRYEDGIEPTELYPTRNEVESANTRRLKALSGEPRNHRALDAPGRDDKGHEYSPERVERALKDMIAPKALPLKIGAQVMLIKNIIQGLLVNGSIGRVVAFCKPRDAMAMGAQIAIPDNQQGLRKAFSGDDAKEGAGASGDAGADSSSGEPDTAQDKVQSEQREAKLKAILALNSTWPCVQFHSGPLMLCVPLSFEVINADGNIEAVREQVPLILAWALSIHKSQGQTLERVRVDLNRIFEKGQAYVALSRATRMETLQVVNFDPSKVKAHPEVLNWMAKHMQKMPALPYVPPDDIDEELEYWGDML